MHFHNRTFESTYLKLIFEQADEGVQFKYICKDCNTGFAEDDGFAEGDACPCEDCDGKLEECVIDDLDPNNMPAQYQANDAVEQSDEATDEATEEAGDQQDEDLQDEDFQDDDFQDDDFQDEDQQDEDFQDEDFQDDDFQDEDQQDEDLQDEDQQDEDFQDEDFQDEQTEQTEDADDEAAAEDTNEQDTEGEQPETKLVSFTAEDPALIELLTQVQNGEIKLVAVPVDFEFEEEEMNEQPAITMDTVGNFAIDDMNEEQEGEENAEAEGENTEAEGEGEENAEAEEQEIAKEAKKKFTTISKPTKYGIY